MRTLTGHSNCVVSVELISPNRLASGSSDNTIKIWNIDKGKCFRTISGAKLSCSAYYLSDKLIRFIN